MKAEELRIGNWVSYRDDNLNTDWISIEIGVSDLIAIESVIKNMYYKPIALTPEILLAAGFERMPLSSIMRYRDTSTLFFLQTRNKKDWFVYGYKYYPNPINYLHELQNLYYCLCGKELNINPQNKA